MFEGLFKTKLKSSIRENHLHVNPKVTQLSEKTVIELLNNYTDNEFEIIIGCNDEGKVFIQFKDKK